MSFPAYVVLTSDEKQGVVYPEIIGPIATEEEWTELQPVLEDWRDSAQDFGGYREAVEVGPETAISPEQARKTYDEYELEYGSEED